MVGCRRFPPRVRKILYVVFNVVVICATVAPALLQPLTIDVSKVCVLASWAFSYSSA